MKKISISKIDSQSSIILFTEVWLAKNYCQRLRGLLGRPKLSERQGLMLQPCNQVHTMGMRYAIDIIFLDGQGVIVNLIHSLKPLRQARGRGAIYTLEVASGMAKKNQLNIGDQLQWSTIETL
jgi:uncharacterized membrane protein (UPF0127 family)